MRRVLVAGLIGVAVIALVGLGVWQLERRVWKLALIDRVEQRVHAEPVAPPDAATLAAGGADGVKALEYTRVRVSGHFLNDRETLVEAVTALGGGSWVMTPLVTASGETILVNRGFVPPDRRSPQSRAAGEISGTVTVTGLLRPSEPKGGFLRSNDPAADRWYSRDVEAIAAKRGLGPVAPYFIDADATPNPGGFPVGGLTVIQFPNNHLVYALTWFALAIGLAGAAIQIGRRGEA